MTLTFAACSGFQGKPASVSVQIPRDCEDLAQRVPPPGVKVGVSAKAALAQHRGALVRANGNLEATRECQVNQRERFAAGL